jgi:hypothetical protein
MNATRRQRPNISPDDMERLLLHLEDARSFIVKYGAAKDFHAVERETADQALQAIDRLAGHITGNEQYFWMNGASAGGNEAALRRGMEKVVKRRRLMGVHIPMRVLKVPKSPITKLD